MCNFLTGCNNPEPVYNVPCRCDKNCVDSGMCCIDFEARCIRNETLPTYHEISGRASSISNGHFDEDIKGKHAT